MTVRVFKNASPEEHLFVCLRNHFIQMMGLFIVFSKQAIEVVFFKLYQFMKKNVCVAQISSDDRHSK